ncbi:MAG: hypothetical protein ACAH95_03995 [Fimbriimonas sp.]
MMINSSFYIGAFWLAFGVAAVFAWPVYKMLLALQSRQTVSAFAPETHQVKQGTPTMGGLIIVAGVLPVLIWHILLPAFRGFGDKPYSNGSSEWSVAALVVFLGFALIGFTDDFLVPRLFPGTRGLGWKQKLLMQVVVGAVAAWLLTGAFGVAAAWTLFTVLFFANAFNFVDGLDGLAATVLLSLASGLMILGSIRGYNTLQAPAMMALAGATIPFLFLNAPPAKLFMGDVGSLPIGALLGLAVSWLAFIPGHALGNLVSDAEMLASLAILSLVMVAEIVPVPLQIFWVKVFKKRLFPYTPIHHAFEKAGWKETRVVALFALIQFILMMLAITMPALSANARTEF